MILHDLLIQMSDGFSLFSPILINVCDDGSLMDATIEETVTGRGHDWAEDYTREYAEEEVIIVGANSLHLRLDQPVSIGRSRKCDVRVENESVSKFHASIVLERTSGSYFVIDESSRNGTFINGEKIHSTCRTMLWSGAYISFGDAVFVFIDPPTLRKLARLAKK